MYLLGYKFQHIFEGAKNEWGGERKVITKCSVTQLPKQIIVIILKTQILKLKTWPITA